MTILVSERKEYFVLNTYRDQVPYTRKSIYQISRMKEIFGPFSYLEKKGKVVNVVLSQDSGYLLAETVLDYLEIRNNPWVVYLEESTDNQALIMVVADQGKILKDVLIPLAHVEEVLKDLARDKLPYQFHLGDSSFEIVPLILRYFAKKVPKCEVNKYKEPIFNKIKSREDYKLNYFNDEVKLKKLSRKNYNSITVALLVFIIGGIILYHHQWLMSAAKNEIKIYQWNLRLRDSFRLPRPTDIVGGIQNYLISLQYGAGWPLLSLDYKPGTLFLTVEGNPARNRYLTAWALSHNLSYDEKTNQLSLPMHPLESNSTLRPIHAIKTAENLLLEKLKQVLPEEMIQQGRLEKKDAHQEIEFTLKIENQTIIFLELIAELLENFPVTIKNIKLKLDNGNTNGFIIFVLRGT